jgi:hypothetical protein
LSCCWSAAAPPSFWSISLGSKSWCSWGWIPQGFGGGAGTGAPKAFGGVGTGAPKAGASKAGAGPPKAGA